MKGRIWIILAALLLCNAIGVAVLMANSEANAAELTPTSRLAATAARTSVAAAVFNSIVVNTVNDEDSNNPSCSLREAVIAANTDTAYNGCAAGSGADTITFNLGSGTQTINLSTALPALTSAISLQGPVNPGSLIIQRATNIDTKFRVFTIAAGAVVTLQGMTICNGLTGNGGVYHPVNNPQGGPIVNGTGIQNSGNLTLDTVIVTANNPTTTAADPTSDGRAIAVPTNNGGGIFNLGTLTLNNTDVIANRGGAGGGIYNTGTLTATTTTVGSNAAVNNIGGGIFNGTTGGNLSLTRSTLIGNRAGDENDLLADSSAHGGGLYNAGGATATCTNVSFGLNEAGGSGKAIYNEGNASPTSAVNLRSVTIGQHAFNLANDLELDNAIYADALSTITYRNSIFANAEVGFANFVNHGSLVSEGNNLCDDNSGAAGNPSDLLDTPAGLDPGGIRTYGTVAENPSRIDTFRLLCDSPAINAASNSGGTAAPATDARNVARVGLPDIGSYEFNFQLGYLNPANSQFTTATALPNFTAGTPYSVTLAAIGGEEPYTFQLAAGSSLPTGFTLNGSSGLLSNNNPTVGGSFTIEAIPTDYCTISKTFTLSANVTNTPPTITPVTLSRTQGSPAGAAVTIATVSDGQTAAGSLVVTQIAGGTATGITLTGITNTNGTITAQVAASCSATSGTVCLQVSDGSLTAKGNLTVNVSTNTDPVLTYNTPAPLCFGIAATINPATGPSDNGSVSSIAVQSVTPSVPNGSITVSNSTGVVTVSNTTPSGLYNVTIRATDNCGKTKDASFTLNVIGSLILSEFRLSGPGGQNDWYVELYNSMATALNTTGLKLGVVNQDGSQVVSYDLPANVSIPSRGYYLIAGSAYSLASSAAANLTAPALAGGFNLAGAGLFKGAVTDPTKRMDSVGMSTINVGATYRFYVEAAPVPGLANTTAQHAFVRKFVTGLPADTNNNAADFILVAPSSTAINGITPQPGAPGPQNASSPLANNTGVPFTLFNTALGASTVPNQFVENVSVTVDGTTYSRSLYLRRKVTNNTGATITKLRFRIIEMSNGGVNTAILRSLNSIDATVDGQPVKGLTLEAPAIGTGGVNSTLCVGTIALPVQLANNASVNVQFRLGVLQGGSYRFFVNVEPQS